MLTTYETKYLFPTDHQGARIKVTNTRTGKSRIHRWDYSVNGGPDQHEHAVRERAEGAVTVTLSGETKLGWLFVVDNGGPW